MKWNPHLLALFLGLTLGGAHAKGKIVDIRWSNEGRFGHEASVNPNEFLELCGDLAPGSTVAWRFSASKPVDFNIHYHLGPEVVFPEKRSQIASGAADLRVSLQQTYCWMWTNKGASASTLQVELRR